MINVSNLSRGAAVQLTLTSVQVGYVPNDYERDCLNRNELPDSKSDSVRYSGWGSVSSVTHPDDGVSHFYPECGGERHKGLSWSVQDTTCPDCLRKRAHHLRGWRWNLEMNAEDVDYLRSILGEEADRIAAEPADDPPKRFRQRTCYSS